MHTRNSYILYNYKKIECTHKKICIKLLCSKLFLVLYFTFRKHEKYFRQKNTFLSICNEKFQEYETATSSLFILCFRKIFACLFLFFYFLSLFFSFYLLDLLTKITNSLKIEFQNCKFSYANEKYFLRKRVSTYCFYSIFLLCSYMRVL